MKCFHPSPRPLLLALISLSPLFLGTPAVVHAQWQPDQRLTFNDSASFTSPHYSIAAGAGGSLHVVWYDNRDGNSEIYYKRSTDQGTTWFQDTCLTHDTASSESPSVSAFGSDVHLVWQDRRDGNYEIYYKRSTDQGTTWSQDTRLTNDLAISEFPAVSASGSNLHIVWADTRNGADTYSIYYKRSTDQGSTWSRDTCLFSIQYYSEYPALAASGGDVHLVWSDWRSGWPNYEIYYQRSLNGGSTWFQDRRLTYDSSFSLSPSVSASGSNVHIVWYDTRDGNEEIYYKRSSDRGMSWTQDLRLTSNASASEYASLALSDTMVHVVWTDWRGGNAEIYYKRNPTGNVVGVERVMNPGSESPARRYQVLPNPFVSFARIPGHEGERFVLYDLSGRRVGAYGGARIASDLPPGVYFLWSAAKDTAPLRIVKIK